jgi:predicted RNase H-like HicB family nuclease
MESMMTTKFYPAFIHKDRTSDFGISFHDFPGCVSAGATLQECLAMGAEALAVHIEGMSQDGETIPEPTDLAVADRAARKDRELALGLIAVQMVPASLPGRVIRLSVSMDEELVKRIDMAAGTHGRSRFLADAARARLGRSLAKVSKKRRSG